MKIALVGYGKMGKEIKNIILNSQYSILLITNNCPLYKELKNVEVAIEFSQPEFAFTNIKFCMEENISIVSGTTGWLNKMEQIKFICLNKSGAFLYASNFSIGVNIFFEINKIFAKLINPYSKKYEIFIEEIHHIHKKDVPSGTSIELANSIIKEGKTDQLTINSKRFKNSPGIHIIKYLSERENFIFKHISLTRTGFALGAVIAAEWINFNYKKGIFSMKDVLNI